MTRAWQEQLHQALVKKFGKKKGETLAKQYGKAFPTNYQESCAKENAVDDIEQMEGLSAKHPLQLVFYEHHAKDEPPLRLRLFQIERPIPLSDILPILENMDLRTYDERPYEITLSKQKSIWISDFSVTYVKNNAFSIPDINELFEDALINILWGASENDGFNKLILGARISWQEINIIRAYAKYLQQTGFRFSQPYIEKTVAHYPDITKNLIKLFLLKYNPHNKPGAAKTISELEATIQNSLEAVISLDEDKILRSLLALIKATLRTNYYLPSVKDYLVLKLDSQHVPDLPLPKPLYEIFVYSPRFEAIHLRSAKVSRGGIRWSDRREDFRVEILGLMKAQKVKNAVIVPSGAKGGFVLKALPLGSDRQTTQAEVITCYKAFIHGLLDVTDNLKNNKVIPPANVVRYDGDDPYLVVAADKGTASFSDIANAISKEYDFWLGDAFASGGSAGYDHKKMGITARGAWESIKRHFHELDVDISKTDITVVGIGDMSGDVFGNGMLYSKRIKLVAAFDHRHIFLDPNPNPEKSYAERQRLFKLPTSSWENYNAKLISAGGGVHTRASKSIPITAEVKKLLNITDNSLAPNELIRAILKAPVDLLYNGGIGTYVKASHESHADVGDKMNEFCRVNGGELTCKIVGEGGNLGFTQLGRVEYALKGGLINTDFIDNSAGVDCSDHEVNLKILLNKEVKKGKLTEKKRNQLLFSLTDEVAELVLSDNFNQALAMSFSTAHANKYLNLYHSYIKELETTGILDRAIEFIPDNKQLLDRKAAGQGLTRPELAVLLAYTKIHVKNEILKSNLPDDPYFLQTLATAFPASITKIYKKQLQEHSLRREIIATQLSNKLINFMGITFIYRLQTETGAQVADIARAYAVSANLFDTLHYRKLIDSLDYKITVATQYELLHHVRQLINLATRWFLHRNRLKDSIESIIEHYQPHVKKLISVIPSLIVGITKTYMETLMDQFTAAGLPTDIALSFATSRALYTSLNIIEVSTQYKLDLIRTALIYFDVGAKFNLVWFRDQIAHDAREGHWNSMARLSLRDELDSIQRKLTIVIARSNPKEKDHEKQIHAWIATHQHIYERWEKILSLLHSNSALDYSMFFIALRELSDLTHTCEAV